MELRQAVTEYDYHALSVTPRMELTPEQVKNLVNELANYHAIYQPYFGNESQGRSSYQYLSGLLDPEIASKSAENIALATVGSAGVRQMQYFIGASRWSEQGMIAEHRRQSGLTLGREEGILIVDGSDIPKQGTESVGVKRQWCGQLGKKANCQAGVFLGYSSRAGYTLLDKRLYLPEEWFTAGYAEKRYKCQVPADLAFQTKNELAWSMIAACAAAGTLAARWLTMDEAFGKDTQLLDRIDRETEYYYFAEVPKDTQLWVTEPETALPPPTGRGRPATKRRLTPSAPASQTVETIATSLATDAWQMHALRQGTKGFLLAQVAAIRVYPSRAGLPGKPCWLVLRRNPDAPTEIHYFLSNAPADTPFDELLYVCAMRWPIEIIFEQAKQLLGLNEYETRTWLGWHHHMTHVILAFGFLARTQAIFRTDAPALTLPQVVDLLKAVLPKPQFDAAAAIELLRYKQVRIASAKKSHFNRQKSKIIQSICVTQ
jgi:SRSO17 transposase